MAAATMDEMFRVFRNLGMSEKHASEAARVVPHRDEVVTRADRETDREAARAVREAERVADREAFAVKDDVAAIKESVARLDEKVNSIMWVGKVIIIPLLLLNLTALFVVGGLLIRILIVLGQ